MANKNEGQDHKDNYFETRNILSEEMTICIMEALVPYFYEVMTNINYLDKIWHMSRSKDLKRFQNVRQLSRYRSSGQHCLYPREALFYKKSCEIAKL